MENTIRQFVEPDDRKDQSKTIGTIALALSKAQATYPVIKKDKKAKIQGTTKEGKKYDVRYNYADLNNIYDAIRPCLNKQEIAITSSITPDPTVATVTTKLIHSSGEWLSTTVSIKSTKPGAQAFGSAIAYAEKYGAKSIAGVASQDDDGALASEHSDTNGAYPKSDKKITQKQVNFLGVKMAQSGWVVDDLKIYLATKGIKSRKDIPMDLFNEILDHLETNMKKPAGGDSHKYQDDDVPIDFDQSPN